MKLKQVTAAAIRAVRHELEYRRLVDLNRCNVAGAMTLLSPQWDRLVKSRNELEAAVRKLRPQEPTQ